MALAAKTLDINNLGPVVLRLGDNDAHHCWGGQVQHGLNGTPVHGLQSALVAVGTLKKTDGVYGHDTHKAVRRFQWYLENAAYRLKVALGTPPSSGAIIAYSSLMTCTPGTCDKGLASELLAWQAGNFVTTTDNADTLRRFHSLLGLAVLMSLLTGSAAQSPGRDGMRKDIEAALRNGKSVVLVVAPAMSKTNDADESYGDWADGLNDFAAHAGADVKVFRLTPPKFSQLLLQPKVKGNFATLFIRESGHALVYEGMVVEPKIYAIGLAYLQHRPDEKAESDYGLMEKVTLFK